MWVTSFRVFAQPALLLCSRTVWHGHKGVLKRTVPFTFVPCLSCRRKFHSSALFGQAILPSAMLLVSSRQQGEGFFNRTTHPSMVTLFRTKEGQADGSISHNGISMYFRMGNKLKRKQIAHALRCLFGCYFAHFLWC